jgi:hypothetical protein
VEEASDFRNTLLDQWGTSFTNTNGINYSDNNVWDTDFLDPEASGRSADNDTTNSDQSGAAVGFFSMHGTCNDGSSTTCSSHYDCLTGGACESNGPYTTSFCVYPTDRYLIVSAYNGHDHYGGDVNYSSDYVRWGESSHSGGWAGAGTNGSLNWAFVDVSCGVRDPFEWTELHGLFAGLHGLGIAMPVNGDTLDDTGRGYYTAYAYTVNHYGSIAEAWRDSLNSTPQTDGAPCPQGYPNYTFGGGHGYDLCGANTTMSVNASAYAASAAQGESWYQATSDSSDATGTGYYYYYYQCNYDCNTFPPSK